MGPRKALLKLIKENKGLSEVVSEEYIVEGNGSLTDVLTNCNSSMLPIRTHCPAEHLVQPGPLRNPLSDRNTISHSSSSTEVAMNCFSRHNSVEETLRAHPRGASLLKSLRSSSNEEDRKALIRIITAELVKTHDSYYPPEKAKVALVTALVEEFPKLKDAKSVLGYTWRDNKTKVSNKFVALKNRRKATGNDPVDIKLTERDEKIIGLLGFDYIEGLDTVPDSFPEEHNNVNELLTEGKESMLACPPQTTSIRSTILTVPQADFEMDDTSTAQRPQIAEIDSNVTSEYVENQTVLENTGTLIKVGKSRPNSSGSQRNVRQLEPEQGPSRVEESLPGMSSSILGKRTVPPTSHSQFMKRGKHHERLGIQLQHAQSEFAEIAQRTCVATELMAEAGMKRAEAALIMANNDKARNEILRTMAENDKARNVVLVSLVGTLDALLRKQVE